MQMRGASGPGAAGSSRRDEKRRMVDPGDTAEPEAGPPPDVGHSPPAGESVDRSAFVGHIATDDKAALARLHEFASAPDDVVTPDASPLAPELDDDDEVPAHLLEQPSAPPMASASVGSLPAPPQRLQVDALDAPAAPWLPVYEPQGSAPPLDLAQVIDASAPPLDSDDEGDDVAPAVPLAGNAPNPNSSFAPHGRLDHAVV